MRRRVHEARVGHLASVGPDGRPHVVPSCFVADGEVIYSAVDAEPKSSRRGVGRDRAADRLSAAGGCVASLCLAASPGDYARRARPPGGFGACVSCHARHGTSG